MNTPIWCITFYRKSVRQPNIHGTKWHAYRINFFQFNSGRETEIDFKQLQFQNVHHYIQCLDSCTSSLKLFQVHLVGILRDYEVQSTKATYRIEDHTGEIKAIWWLESDTDSVPNLPLVKEGNYVQVFGSIRNKEEGKMVMVLKMFPVEDCNILTNHLLQVVHARLSYEAMNKSTVRFSQCQLIYLSYFVQTNQ